MTLIILELSTHSSLDGEVLVIWTPSSFKQEIKTRYVGVSGPGNCHQSVQGLPLHLGALLHGALLAGRPFESKSSGYMRHSSVKEEP